MVLSVIKKLSYRLDGEKEIYMNAKTIYFRLCSYYDMGYNTITIHSYANFMVRQGQWPLAATKKALDIFDTTHLILVNEGKG